MLTRVIGGRRVVAALVLPYVLLGLVWAFANPGFAAPDEDAHLVKALGLARFDIGVPGPPAAPGVAPAEARNASITRVVEIPARLDPTGYACFKFQPSLSATCQPAHPARTEGDAAVATTLGAYPPFLYPPLGWAAGLGTDPVQAVVLGRLVILAISALLPWLGCAQLVRWLGPRSLLGVPVLMTPMAVFCLGIMNTSAIEILGAFGMATVVVTYAWRPDSLSATGSQVLLLVSGTALVLSRQLGVVTMALLTVLLLVLGGWREVVDGLRARRPVTWAAVLVLAAATAAVAVWEVAYDHPVLLGPWVSADSLRAFLAQLGQLVQESVGWFGWLDVRPPAWVNLVWVVAGLVLVIGGLVLGERRDRVVIATGLGVGLLVSYVTYARVFYGIDAGLQGRHVLPIFALVPVWCGVVWATKAADRLVHAVGLVAAVALPLVLLAGLVINARRYAGGPALAWSPPLGWYPWGALALLGTAGLSVAILRISRPVATPSGR